MDKARFSFIAHGNLPVWNPVGTEHLERYVARLALPPGGQVLDVGCGRGYLLRRIVSEYDVTAIGVDSSPFAIGAATRDMPAHVTGRITLLEQAFDEREFAPSSIDLVICIGSMHVLGNYVATLRAARRLLRPGGKLLVGEGYWKTAPSSDYLTFMQMSAAEKTTHEGNQLAAIAEGLRLVSSSECSVEEWDAYEERYAENVESYVANYPDDPDIGAMLERIRPWREAYLRWGRDTLGFGLYLLAC
jgi:cyclopropane fatty-acyl-phospholipid synthase-like methyltransferase